MINRSSVRKMTRDDAGKLPVLAEPPAKIAAKVRDGGSVIADVLEQAKNAALVLATWQGELIEQLAPYIEAGEVFAKKQELFRKYGGVSDLVELIDTYPVSDGGKEEVYGKINEKMSEWLESNPGASPLAPRFRFMLINALLREFNCPSLDRIPCHLVPEVLDWIDSYQMTGPMSFGPLPAVLMSARAEKNISISRAAEACGTNLSTYRSWESGRRIPRREKWPALKSFTGRSDIEEVVLMQRDFLRNRRLVERACRLG
ncbi:MAG: helix-turn-helix domain-containing protein [Thermacetogeniaceae bacterium]